MSTLGLMLLGGGAAARSDPITSAARPARHRAPTLALALTLTLALALALTLALTLALALALGPTQPQA